MSSRDESVVWRKFCDGRFRSLKEDNRTNSELCLQKKILNSNNAAVCDFMMANNDEERNSSNSALFDHLQTCYSIPVMEENLFSELIVLYNYLYTGITCKDGSQSTCIDHRSWLQAVNKTLYRVYKLGAMKDTKCTNVMLPCARQSPEESFVTLAERCLSRLTYITALSARLVMPLCLCINLVCIKRLQDEHRTLQILDNVSCALETLPHIEEAKGIKSEDGLLIPVEVDHRDVHIVSTSMCREYTEYLRALYLYGTGRWSDGHKCLQSIKDSELKIVANFISGWCLYRSGEYLESVSLLMETLRSLCPLTQRLKARIYNLIAMCFHKLDKAQLALQMYKEALSADFGYLLPLYRTSIMYKQQASIDMELECLNLLVTAIEMREPSTYVSMRLDLLNLFVEEDGDIDYPTALYCFASRALALQKYEISAERYLALISHIKSWQGDAQVFKDLPALSQIHQETIQALLKAEKYSECVSMCDTLLTACGYHGSVTSSHNGDITSGFHGNVTSSNHGDANNTTFADSIFFKNSQDSNKLSPKNNHDNSMMNSNSCVVEFQSSSAKKRKCRESIDLSSVGGSSATNVEAVTLKVKANALLKLGDKDLALSCLDRATESVAQYRKSILQTLAGSSDEPSAKRRKLDPENSPSDAGDTSTTMLDIECDIYGLTEQILTSQGRDKEAQHYSCLQQQLKLLSSRLTH